MMKNLFLLGCFGFLFLYSGNLFGQSGISGESNPELDTEYTYSISNVPCPDNSCYWGVSGGQTVGSPTLTNVKVKWTTAGNQRLTYNWDDELGETEELASFNVSVIGRPDVPSAPTQHASSTCYDRVLQRGTPPSGVRYYWQNVVGGTSTSLGYASTFNVPSNGTYYLSAYDTNKSLWSSTTSTGISVAEVPAPNTSAPSVDMVTSYCTGGSLPFIEIENPQEDDIYYVEGSASLSKGWNDRVDGIIRFDNLTAGTYSVKVANKNCTNTKLTLQGSTTIVENSDNRTYAIDQDVGNASNTFCAGTVTFSAVGGTAGTQYFWEINNSPVGTTSSPTFTPQAIHAGTNLTLSVRYKVAGSCSGVALQGEAEITGLTFTAPKTPSVTISPSSNTVCSGSSIGFSFEVRNATNYTYSWGHTSSTAREVNRTISANDTKTSITVNVTDACVTTTQVSHEVEHDIHPGPNTSAPSVDMVTSYCAGGSLPFIEIENPQIDDIYYVEGSANLSKGWNDRVDGIIRFDNLTAGTYSVKVANKNCPNAKSTLQAATAIVENSDNRTYAIDQSVGNAANTFCTGTVTFSAIGGTADTQYFWEINNSPVGTTSSSTFSPEAIHAGSNLTLSVRYKVAASCSGIALQGEAEITGLTFTAPKTPSVTLNASPDPVCLGESARLTFNVEDATNYTYSWGHTSSTAREVDRIIDTENTTSSININVTDACVTETQVSDQVLHEVYQSPNIADPSVEMVTIYCPGSTAFIEIQNPQEDDIYYVEGSANLSKGWGDRVDGIITFPNITAGTYSVKVANKYCPNNKLTLQEPTVITLKQNVTAFAGITVSDGLDYDPGDELLNVCGDDNLVLSKYASELNVHSWYWKKDGTKIFESDNEESIPVTESGVYQLFLEDWSYAKCASGTISNPSIEVEITTMSNLESVTIGFSECELLREISIDQLSDGSPVPSSYVIDWYDQNDSFVASGNTYDFAGLAPGVYHYSVQARDEAHGCLSADRSTVAVTIQEPQIEITGPASNDLLSINATYSITWNPTHVHDLTEVDFRLIGHNQSVSIPDPSAWVISGSLPLGTQYRIEASVCGHSFYSEYFRIGDPVPRGLASPEDFSLVIQETQEQISWSEDTNHNFNIFLASADDGPRMNLDPSRSYISTDGLSSFDWVVNNTLLGDYVIIVEEENELWSYEANVEVVEALDIVTPNTATVYGLNEMMRITWEGGSIKPDRPVITQLKWYDKDTEMEVGSSVIPATEVSSRRYQWRVDPDLDENYKYKVHLSQELQAVGQTPVREMTDISTDFFLVQDCPNAANEANLPYNYVKTYIPRIQLSGCVSAQDDASKVQESIQFLDGLGRPQQQVMRQYTPDGRDLVTQVKYDEFGREVGAYLPFKSTSTEGLYVSDWETPQKDFYDPYGERDHAFSETVLEHSPLSRPLAQAAPGEVWGTASSTEHLINYSYSSNFENEVRIIHVVNGAMESLANYDPGTLHVNIINDENEGDLEGETIEYTDVNGRVILKKVKIAYDVETEVTTYASTYYVYDDFNNLRFVIQPEGVRRLDIGEFSWNALDDETLLSRWVFSYQYDERQRMIAKRVPGADWMYMVYDQRDRLVLTQDGNQRKFETIESDKSVAAYEGVSYYAPNATVELTAGFRFTASATNTFVITAERANVEEEWIYTKYDRLNRPVVTGKVMLHGSRDNQASDLKTWTGAMSESRSSTYDQPFGGYSNVSYPAQATDAGLLTVSYYDDYDFIPTDELDTDEGINMKVKGLNTGSLTKVLGSDEELLSLQYYDSKLRPYKTYTENIMDVNGVNGSDEVALTYESAVSPLIIQSDLKHTGPQGTYHLRETTTYDQMGRPKLMKHQFGPVGSLGSEVVLSANEYNDLGELITKRLGGVTTPVQKVDYKYNIRGWLTAINHGTGLYDADDKFVMQLNYQQASNDYIPNFNGNISEMMWQTMGGNGNQPTTEQRFRYTYDAMNRLGSATYVGGVSDGAFDVGDLGYDYNGNIASLSRKQWVQTFNGSGLGTYNALTIDDLTYTYANGNQLTEVLDAAAATSIDPNDAEKGILKDLGFKDGATNALEYRYDDNGNMIADLNKGISNITYNHLNLPEEVTTDDANITYTYDALGMKLQKTVVSGASTTITSYVNGIHYSKETSGSHELDFIQHSEGRLVNSPSGWEYEYNLTDHLGNVRVTIDKSGNVIQRDDYYPFGLTFNHWNQSTQGGGENLYKYNDFEEQKETGWYDYLARYYDPELGRFNSIDPLSDLMRRYSPYTYAFDNPIRFTDPDGMMPSDSVKRDGGCIGCDGSADQNALINPPGLPGTVKPAPPIPSGGGAGSSVLRILTSPLWLLATIVSGDSDGQFTMYASGDDAEEFERLARKSKQSLTPDEEKRLNYLRYWFYFDKGKVAMHPPALLPDKDVISGDGIKIKHNYGNTGTGDGSKKEHGPIHFHVQYKGIEYEIFPSGKPLKHSKTPPKKVIEFMRKHRTLLQKVEDKIGRWYGQLPPELKRKS